MSQQNENQTTSDLQNLLSEDLLRQLEERIRVRFRNRSLLIQALTHPSIRQEGIELPDNERLEFLGDSVLQLVLTEELFRRHPDKNEGLLTKVRAHLVNKQSLAFRARRLQLGQCLLLGRGEEQSGGRDRPSTLADAMEALVGAIYLDQGLEAVRRFVLPLFEEELETAEVDEAIDNPKGALQEFLQAISNESPKYQLLSVTGPNHARQFECAVYHAGQELARGVGTSKKAAEAAAALKALRRLRAEAQQKKIESVESQKKESPPNGSTDTSPSSQDQPS